MTTARKTASRVVAALLVLVALLAAPSAAHAWWRGGVGFGFGFVPLYVPPPPVYVPPPVYYYAPPPPVYYETAPSGQACYAGSYVCPLDRATPVGGPCSCPTNSGRAAGKVG